LACGLRVFSWPALWQVHRPQANFFLSTHPRIHQTCGTTVIKEHECVVLTKNLPDEGLMAGDVGTVVHIHKAGEGYEVEFMTLTGETVAVVTLLADQVRPLNRRDLAHTRELASA